MGCLQQKNPKNHSKINIKLRYVGVSLSKSPTQASKIMKAALLTYQYISMVTQ